MERRFAVATVMLTTTCLIALQITYVKGRSLWLALAFFLTFGFFDGESSSSSYSVVLAFKSASHRLILGCCVEESTARCLGTADDWLHPVITFHTGITSCLLMCSS